MPHQCHLQRKLTHCRTAALPHHCVLTCRILDDVPLLNFIVGLTLGHGNIVDLLLPLGKPAIEAGDKENQTAMLLACQKGQTEVVEKLLLAQAEVNSRSKSGTTPLWEAASNGHPDILHILLGAGASVTSAITKSPASITCLHQACANGHAEVVQILLDRMEKAGAKTSYLKLLQRQCGSSKASAIHAAAAAGHAHVIPLLLKAEDTIDSMPVRIGSRQATGLSLMSRGMTRGATMMQRGNTTMSMASMAALSTPLLDSRDAAGKTALHIASESGRLETVKVLLEEAEKSTVGYERPSSGFPVDNQGRTPVHLVAESGGDPEVLDTLLSYLDSLDIAVAMHGIGAGICDFSGETALLVACRSGNVECVYRLLEEYMDSADSELLINKCSTGDEASHCLLEAVRFNHLEILEILLKKRQHVKRDVADADGWGPLHIASYHGGTDAAEMLVAVGVPIEARGGPDNAGATALMQCCCHDQEPTLSMLMGKGAQARVVDNTGATALHYAARYGEVPNDCVDTLVQAVGLSLESANADKQTPLHIAAANGHADFCHMLISKYHAEISPQDKLEQTVLHYACKSGNEDVAQAIISAAGEEGIGAVLEVPDASGMTPLFGAVASGVIRLVDTLLELDADPAAKSSPETGSKGLLHVAVEARIRGDLPDVDWLNMAACLLQNGAPVVEGDANGQTAFELASNAGDEAMVHCFEGGFTSLDPVGSP